MLEAGSISDNHPPPRREHFRRRVGEISRRGAVACAAGQTRASREIFWAAAWLALVLIAAKAYCLARMTSAVRSQDYVRWLTAVSYLDVLFVSAMLCVGIALVRLAGDRPRLVHAISVAFLLVSSFFTLYQVANVIIFRALGGFITYPLLTLIGDVRMIRSSIAAHLTPGAALGLMGVPVVYATLVLLTVHFASDRVRSIRLIRAIACAFVALWVLLGHHVFASEWAHRVERRIAENPPWVFLSSWWRIVGDGGVVRMTERYLADDLAEFEPAAIARAVQPALFQPPVVQRAALGRRLPGAAATRAPNVILVVLESVAARWASLNNTPYNTTPTLKSESARSAVFDNFYAHIGRSSNSLATILLSTYPKLDFRDLTEEYPRLPGTSLASVFRDRGYRTAFLTPSNLNWAGWDTFLEGRGFDDIRDYRDLACSDMISSWGVEDRCMVDDLIRFVRPQPARPFFLMAWTTQTHHPYEPTPGVPLLDLIREPVRDDWDLGRYLNVLHETDRHLGRLFDAVRHAGLDQNTLIVVTGDHGQAFGYPHESYSQGRTVYEEDVHVPLMFWFPGTYQSEVHSKRVGSHVDLAPTIAELAGLPPVPGWQGRSLFDGRAPGRAYFYVAEDQFTLGIRDGNWKYMLSLREGFEELYDLDRDPTERNNLAALEPERCARLRQRLAAWTEANRRQYEHVRD